MNTLRRLGDHMILITGAVLMIGPLAYLMAVSVGFSSLDFSGYRRLLTEDFGFSGEVTIYSMIGTSFAVALAFGVLKTLFALLAAYALVFFRVRHALAIFFAILITLYLPLHARPIQTYLTASELGLADSYGGLIIPLLASGLGVLLFRQFCLTVPDTLVEAARIDGASGLRFFVDILVPLSLPFSAALFAIHFVEGWNLYLWPILIIAGEEHTTIMRGLSLVGQRSGVGLALGVLASLPPLALVFLLGPVIARAMHFDSADR